MDVTRTTLQQDQIHSVRIIWRNVKKLATDRSGHCIGTLSQALCNEQPWRIVIPLPSLEQTVLDSLIPSQVGHSWSKGWDNEHGTEPQRPHATVKNAEGY